MAKPTPETTPEVETPAARRARREARTLEQQIADLQAKQALIEEKAQAKAAAELAEVETKLSVLESKRQTLSTRREELRIVLGLAGGPLAYPLDESAGLYSDDPSARISNLS